MRWKSFPVGLTGRHFAGKLPRGLSPWQKNRGDCPHGKEIAGTVPMANEIAGTVPMANEITGKNRGDSPHGKINHGDCPRGYYPWLIKTRSANKTHCGFSNHFVTQVPADRASRLPSDGQNRALLSRGPFWLRRNPYLRGKYTRCPSKY